MTRKLIPELPIAVVSWNGEVRLRPQPFLEYIPI